MQLTTTDGRDWQVVSNSLQTKSLTTIPLLLQPILVVVYNEDDKFSATQRKTYRGGDLVKQCQYRARHHHRDSALETHPHPTKYDHDPIILTDMLKYLYPC